MDSKENRKFLRTKLEVDLKTRIGSLTRSSQTKKKEPHDLNEEKTKNFTKKKNKVTDQKIHHNWHKNNNQSPLQNHY